MARFPRRLAVLAAPTLLGSSTFTIDAHAAIVPARSLVTYRFTGT